MTDSLQVGLDPKPLVEGLAVATSALAEFKAAVASLNNTPTAQLKQEMQGLTGAMQTLTSSLEGVFGNVAKQVESSMKSAQTAAKAGAKGIKKAVQAELDEGSPVVNIRVSAKSVNLPGGLKASLSQKGAEDLSGLVEIRKSLSEMAGASDTAGAAYKNLTKNAQFAKKSLEEQLEVAKLVKEASKIDGMTAKQLTEQYGTKAVWASRNIDKVSAKAEAQTLATEQLTQRAADLQAAERMELEAFRRAQKAKQSEAAVSQKEQLTQRAADLQAAERMELEAFRRAQKAKQSEAERTARILANQSSYAGTPITSGTYSVLGGPNEGALRQVNRAMQDGAPAAKNLQAAQAALRAEMHELHSAARGLASGFGAMWMTWGSIAPLIAGAAVSSAVVQTIKLGADVQDSLTRMRVLTDESAASVDGLSARMLELSRTGTYGPKEVAEAMKVLALAGQSAEQVGASIKDVLNFSLAGDVSIQTSADTLTTVATAFKVGADGFGYISDVISKAAAESKSSVEDVAGAMKSASVINMQYGVSLEEAAVGISLLANAGIRGTAAGTALRNMYADLGGKTKKVADELKSLGVTAFDPVTGKMRETQAVFKELMNALETQKTPEGARRSLETLFGERGSKEAFALIDALGKKVVTATGEVTNAYEVMLGKVRGAAGFTAIAAAEIALTPLNQMKSVVSTLQASLVETFKSAEPYLLETADNLKKIFASDGFKSALQDLIVGLGTVISFVTEHAKAIASVLLTYAGFRAAATMVTGLAAAWNAVATAEAAATAGAVAAGAASRAVPLLRAISGAVGLAATAWGIYEIAMGKAVPAPGGVTERGMDALIKNLESEKKHLDNVNEARLRSISLLELENEQKGAAAKLEARTYVDAAKAKADEAQSALDKFKRTHNSGMASYLAGDTVETGTRLGELESQLKSANAELARAEGAYKAQVSRLNDLKSSVVNLSDYNSRMADVERVLEERRRTMRFKGTDNGDKPEKAGTEKLSAYEKLNKAIEDELALSKAQLENNDKLSASEKYRIKTLGQLADLYLAGKISADEWATSSAKAWEIIDLKKHFEDTQAYAKMVEASTAAHLSAVSAQDKRNESLRDQIEKQRESNAAIGLSAEAVGELEKATLLLNAAELDRKANLEDGVMRSQDAIDGLREQARLTRELAEEKRIGGAKKAANEARKEWEKTAEKINDSITDALMRGFENGKPLAENLRDTISNMFKTLVLRPTVSAVVNPLTQGITGAFQSAGSSMMGSAAGNFGAGSLFSAAGMTALGESFGASAMATMTGSSFANATVVGQFAGGGAAGTGVASTLGAAMPYIAAAVLAYKVHEATQGEQRFGGQYDNNGSTTNFISGPSGGQIAGGNVTKAIDATISGINATLKTLGSTQSVSYFNAGLESSGNGKGFTYAGGTLTDGSKFGQGFGTGFNNNRGDKSAEQAIAEFGTELKQATLTALQSATDIPKTISDVLRGQDSTAMVDAVTKGLRLTGRDIATLSQDTTQALLGTSKDISTLSDSATNDLLALVSSIQNTVTGFNEAVKALPFEQLKGLSFDAAAGLLAAAGGLDRLTTGLNSYYQNFYTAEEKKAQTIQNINRVLTEGGALVSGVMPTTRDAFRKLVEAQDLTTESGQKAYVALLSVGDAFASVTSDVVSSIKKLLDDKAKIEVDLLTAQGNKDAARAAQRAIDIKDFSDAEVAAYDYNQSIKDQIAVLNERKGLQDQLDSVTLTSVQLLAKQRGALDASNQALFDQVQAATAAADAMKDLAAANQSLKSSRASVTSAFKAIKDSAFNAAKSVETAQDNITNGYVSAQNAVASAQDNLANIAAQAAKAMSGFADSIQQLLTEMATTDLGASSKAGQLAALKADFAIASAQAKAGDTKALGALTSKASALLKEGRAQASTAQDFARLSSSVANTLSEISSAIAPSAAAAEIDPVVKAQAELSKAQAELSKWTNAVAVSGANTAKSSSDYLDEWRKATAANTTAQADLLAAQEATKGIELTIADGISGLLDAINTLNDNIADQASLTVKALKMTVKGKGGTEAGAANYSGTQVADSIKSMQASGASTAQIVSRASTGFGVASEDLAKVADVVGNTGITAYQKAADSVTALGQATRESVISQANAIAAAQKISPERALYDYATTHGINAAMVDKYMGWPNGTSNAWATSNNLPAFRVGTNYVPHDMDARIHEGEAIVPKQYNPAAGGFQNADLEAKVDVLNALISKLLSSAQRSEESNRYTAKVLKLVTRDGDGMVLNEITKNPVTVV